jgi:hypothetical protein
MIEVEIGICEDEFDAITIARIGGGVFLSPGVYSFEADITSYE